MPKAYVPADAEAKWYPAWEEGGCFRASADTDKPSYTIVIPPPNVTGMLTLGHVLNNTLQDILIRWRKLQGYEVCWVPGTDHAGIATQSKVEGFLRETENLSRYDLGREAFLERVWQWKEKYGGTIIRQLRRLGASCDWERERFTLDDGLSNAVEEVFIRLYKKGLIYKGHRIINWCPKSRTALSDEEVIYKQVNGHLWHFQYPLSDGGGQLTVATTRPETMLGDTAVAVHPEDERYKKLIGRTLLLPIVRREIPIIADEYVDREFGTGAVKVTPAHDPNDYEMGVRHSLPMINVMNDDGTMNHEAGEGFEGLDRFEARKKVVAQFEAEGLLAGVDDHVHQVGYSERGDVPVEPRLSEQWFVHMKPLAEPALQAVEDGRIRFHPERWVKTYRHWMENIRDWCISRQLWWGHRIPAYTCAGCGEIVVDRAQPEACPKCHTREFHQEEDVLDTWFSSWLWPFSVFGWPEDNADLHHFYPTNSLVTGPDIIFFWVARMVMAGLEFMGDIPFEDVYFTSIIRDEQGRKLSKSLNNSPDPIEVMDTYGADALRFTIIYIAPVGQDIRYSNEKCEIGRNFANKLWNAARFRVSQWQAPAPGWEDPVDVAAADLRADDRWILARASRITAEATDCLNRFSFHEMTHALYEFVWNEFCDWYLESAKAVLNSGDDRQRAVVQRVFDHVFSRILRLLHPVMPFVTEELYHQLGFIADDAFLTDAAWPEAFDAGATERLGTTDDLVEQVSGKFELIRAVRNIRSAYNVAPNRPVDVVLRPVSEEAAAFLREDEVSLRALLNAGEITVDAQAAVDGPKATAVTSMGTAYVPLEGLIDLAAERARLQKQAQEILGFIRKAEGKLNNEKFVSKAPAQVVQRERDNLSEQTEKLERLRAQMAALQQ
mgnify:CR=1 FL=1